MNCVTNKSLKFCIGKTALLAALSGSALAVDGVTLIDQNKALAGNVTPGDGAGFPVTISQPGSYRLAGNLTVPNGNTTAIEITASHVTLDLNGFAILGSTDCSGGLNPCAGAGSGYGIVTPNFQFNITIRNGTIQGLGGTGIVLRGDSHLVEYVHARSNGGSGILVASPTVPDLGNSIVQNNTAQRNGGYGIFLSCGAARHNVADTNKLSGILVNIGSASNNVSTHNGDVGAYLFGTTTSYIGNVFRANANGHVSGGVNLGQNLCGDSECP